MEAIKRQAYMDAEQIYREVELYSRELISDMERILQYAKEDIA